MARALLAVMLALAASLPWTQALPHESSAVVAERSPQDSPEEAVMWGAPSLHGRAALALGDIDPPPACSIVCQSKVTRAYPGLASASSSSGGFCHPDPAFTRLVTACVTDECSVMDSIRTMKFKAQSCRLPWSDRRRLVLGCVWAFVGFATVGAGLRLMSRYIVEDRFWGWDDAVVALTLAANIGGAAMMTVAVVDYGYGTDIWFLNHDEIAGCIKLLFTSMPVYVVSSSGLKVSIVVFYLRVFTRLSGNRRFRALCYAMLGIICAHGVVHVFLRIFACSPAAFQWEEWDMEHRGVCHVSRFSLGLSHAVTNCVLDMVLFVMPIPKLWRLNLPLRQKVMGVAMFSFGLVTIVCAVFRLVDFGRTGWDSGTNITTSTVPFIIWTVAEINVGLFCACIPTAARCLAALLPRLFPSSSAERSSAQKQSGGSGGGKAGDSSSGSRKRDRRWRGSRHDGIELDDDVVTHDVWAKGHERGRSEDDEERGNRVVITAP